MAGLSARGALGGPVYNSGLQPKIRSARPVCRPFRGTPRRQLKLFAAQDQDAKGLPEPSAAFLLSVGAYLTALPVHAAATAVTQQAAASLPPITPAPVPVPTEAVDSAVRQIIDVVKAAGGGVKSGLGVAAQGAGYVKEAADVAAPYVKKSVAIAAPYVKATANLVSEIVKPVVRAAGPVFQSGVGEVDQFLNRQGLNSQALLESTRGVTSKEEEAIGYAAPTVRSTAGELSRATPAVLAEYALGLLALYYLGPPVLKGVFGSFRGYAGEITAAAALDAVSNDNNAVVIDIRTAGEKEYAGIPDLPNRNRLVELEFATVTDRRVRSQLRNAAAIEKQMTVLQIAALKKVKKRTRVLLMDKNGGGAKDIARALSQRGYKRVFVVSGGFGSWTASKLQTRGSSSVSAVEVLGPIFGTRSTSNRGDKSGKATRYLPSGR